MAYYRGDYYGGRARGDFYRGRMQRGDPFWGALWSGIKTVGGALLGAAIRPASAGGVSGVVQSQQIGGVPNNGAIGFMQTPKINTSIVKVRQPQPGELPPPMPLMPSHLAGGTGMKRRRMNPANAKALRRSIRRVVGFGRLAMRSRRAVGKAATALQCYRPGARRAAPRRR